MSVYSSSRVSFVQSNWEGTVCLLRLMTNWSKKKCVLHGILNEGYIARSIVMYAGIFITSQM